MARKNILIKIIFYGFLSILLASQVPKAMAYEDGEFIPAELLTTKQVRNLTAGGNFAPTANTQPGDTVMFMVTLQASDGGQGIENISVRDSFPPNLYYNNQMTVSGADNYSGDILSGLNFESIEPGQTINITYQAQISAEANFPYGTTLLSNDVTVMSPFGFEPGANATVCVTRIQLAPEIPQNLPEPPTSTPTGLTNNIFTDSFVIPLGILALGLWSSHKILAKKRI